MMLANLRGLKESGTLFAGPTYIYIFALGLMLVVGLYRSYSGDLAPLAENTEEIGRLTGGGVTGGLTLFILLRAFSSGAIALSGTEAISDGVPAFREPSAKNAARTLGMMGIILGVFFFGISVLAHRLRPTPSEHETLLSIMGSAVFGDGTPLYLLLQVSTFAILILAANTAYADFPRLSSFIARDGFLPRQLANRGDRLVFSNGVVLLSVAAALLVIAFGGETSKLIHLYAVGVFTGFTLSQTGMVRYHLRNREPRWRRSMIINATGAVATGTVLIVVIVSKFTVGAYIPTIVIPIIVVLFKGVKRHYVRVESALAVPAGYRPRAQTHTVIVLVGRVHRATLAALSYAKSLAPDRLVAMSVVSDGEQADRIQQEWDEHQIDVPLHITSSPYRDLTGPVLEYIDEMDARHENDIVSVILPEFVLTKWWEQLLHNQSALLLKGRLLFRRNTVVISVPYHIEHGTVEVPGTLEKADNGNGNGNGKSDSPPL
jgi:hypothetical protein